MGIMKSGESMAKKGTISSLKEPHLTFALRHNRSLQRLTFEFWDPDDFGVRPMPLKTGRMVLRQFSFKLRTFPRRASFRPDVRLFASKSAHQQKLRHLQPPCPGPSTDPTPSVSKGSRVSNQSTRETWRRYRGKEKHDSMVLPICRHCLLEFGIWGRRLEVLSYFGGFSCKVIINTLNHPAIFKKSDHELSF